MALVLACSAGGGSGGTNGDEDTDGNGNGDGDGTNGSGDGNGGGLDGVGSANGTGSSGGGEICEIYEATSEPTAPTVLILLDQSGSMKAAEGSTTRWDAATSSVIDAVTSLDGVANFGLIGFPTHVITSDADASQTCNAELKSAPAPGNGAALAATIDTAAPQMGHTPVRAALQLARTELAKPAYADTNRYVVLVTDGLPNCKGIAPTANGGYFANYEDPSDAVLDLANDGITTFVVGYGIAGLSAHSEGSEHFAETYADNMAEAGGTGSHRSVSSGAELEQVLSDITREVAPCEFQLSSAPRGGAEYVRVTIDDTDYAMGDADGWTLVDGTTVSLSESGAACQTLRDGQEHSIHIQVECQPVEIVIR